MVLRRKKPNYGADSNDEGQQARRDKMLCAASRKGRHGAKVKSNADLLCPKPSSYSKHRAVAAPPRPSGTRTELYKSNNVTVLIYIQMNAPRSRTDPDIKHDQRCRVNILTSSFLWQEIRVTGVVSWYFYFLKIWENRCYFECF